MTDAEPLYMQNVRKLLDHYEEGWNIFKNARDWTHPVNIKPESAGVPDLPDNWIDLAKEVLGILARDRYGLETFDNTIQIVNQKQMLDAMVSGLPILPYDHWSFGKRVIMQEWAYNAGRMGKLYEVIFNTDPALVYCMDSNSKTEQLLVIAHACYGHNSFNKGNPNHSSRNPATILDDVQRLRQFVRDCEKKYGIDHIERFLDSCHALQSHAIDLYRKPKPLSAEERRRRALELDEHRRRHFDPDREAGRMASSAKEDFGGAAAEDEDSEDKPLPPANEENILRYIAENAPHLKPYERKIINAICENVAYFYPISTSQVMNEGWASFWHHRLVTDLEEMGLIDEGMYIEFLNLHTSICEHHKEDQGTSPYVLGFAMWQDIRRICENPTEEDRKWRPEIAGKGDWLAVFKEIATSFWEDEDFITQYLSPAVIRQMRFFAVDDDSGKDYIEVTAIHNQDGYDKIRQKMAAHRRMGEGHSVDKMHSRFDRPDIRAIGYHPRTYELTLHHNIFNEKKLDGKDTYATLLHMRNLWRAPITLKSLEPDGRIATTMRCGYDADKDSSRPQPKP